MLVFNSQRKSICSTLLKMHALLATRAPCECACKSIEWIYQPCAERGEKANSGRFLQMASSPFHYSIQKEASSERRRRALHYCNPVQTHWQRFYGTNMSKTIIQCDYISTLTIFWFLIFFPETQQVAKFKTSLFGRLPSSGTTGGVHDVIVSKII